MTGWLIAGGILLVLFILLLSPVRIHIRYRGESLEAKLSFLFLRFDFSPAVLLDKLSAKKVDVPKETAPKKAPEPPSEPSKKKEINFYELAYDLLRASEGARHILKKHIVLDRVSVHAAVCSEDAHKTALSFVSVSSAVYALLGSLGLLLTLKTPDIHICPDFTGQKSRYTFALRLWSRPWFLLAAGLKLLTSFLIIQNRKKPRKGGTKYEPTTASYQ